MSSYRIVHGTTQNLPDVAAFIDLLNTLEQNPAPEVHGFFERDRELFVTRAPGRLDVMGGIADYSGSLVLEMPIQEATLVALQRDSDRALKIVSLTGQSEPNLTFEMSLAEFESAAGPLAYEAARSHFRGSGRDWAAYVAGVFLVLRRERGIHFSEGARILIWSHVPLGKGVSSSAALEVAVMKAVLAAFGIQLEGREMALLCQMVENLVVGAPCGVMDQMTSSCGEANRLLPILCQPAELRETIVIPDEIRFWGLDSGVRHSISGADYGTVRAGAFMGYRILADLAGLEVTQSGGGAPVRIIDPRWQGYLSNVTPSEFEQSYASQLPERLEGAEFLARYRNTTDSLTRINPEHSFAVRVPTAHAIYEHHRVRLFSELLDGNPGERRLELLGELMYQSHASYSACGLGVAGPDRLVELVREAGPEKGLYGAKITGGGSGGTVALLGKPESGPAVNEIANKYAAETGRQPYLFAGSSPGCSAFGHLTLSAVS